MFSVATANTQESRLLAAPEGLRPFEEREVDILLLQEVFGHNRASLSDIMQRAGYGVIHYAGEMGLAIAMRQSRFLSRDILGVGQTREEVLWTPKIREKLIGKVIKPERMRDRGLAAMQLFFDNQTSAGVVTTHPIVFARPRSRRKHIEGLDAAMTRDFAGQALIIGGDMNHFPVPRGIDNYFRTHQALTRAAVDRPTWMLEGSRHEWLARPLAALAGRAIETYNAELDSVLYRGVRLVSNEVVEIESDHRAIVTQFEPPTVDITV